LHWFSFSILEGLGLNLRTDVFQAIQRRIYYVGFEVLIETVIFWI
jgi:hypothetical protein